MARTTARAAVMQMIFEHMAGGEGGEETLQMVYEALRKEGLPGVDSISENEPSESDRAYITKVSTAFWRTSMSWMKRFRLPAPAGKSAGCRMWI